MQPLIRQFDAHAPPAIRHVVEVAQFLSVSEPEVFRLAYRYWYQRELNEPLLDELFAGYLKREELPGWVRSYCTRLLQKVDTGLWDPTEFGVSRPGTHRPLDQQAAAWLTFAGFLFYWLVLA